MSADQRQPGRRTVLLSAPARNALDSRVRDVSTSHVLNSIVIRYHAIITELYPAIERKFDALERQAMINLYAHYTQRSKHSLWRFDTRTHLQLFCSVYRNAMNRGCIEGLSESQSRKLLEVLERHTTTAEFLALCDWLSLQSTHQAVLNDA